MMKPTHYPTVIWLIAATVFSLTGCNLAAATPVPASVATVPVVRLAQVATPTATPAPPTVTPLPSATPEPTRVPYLCSAEATGEAIQHTVDATINYAAKSVEVAQETLYRNETDDALTVLVFDVQPNTWDNAFSLAQLTVNGVPREYTLNQNRLEVPLAVALDPSCAVTIELAYALQPPEIGSGLQSFRGFFGHSERQLNLSLWLPTVAPYRNRTWLIHEPQTIGEQIVLEQADWEVTLTVNNASGDLKVAAPGQMTQLAPNQWQYTLTSARDFSVSLSEQYRVTRQSTENGIIVELYYFDDAINGAFDGATHTLTTAAQSMQQFSSLFGAYPYERMIVVQGDFPDGMEFTGLVYVSTAWFYGYEGGVQNYLTLITVHEIAHQWWYARVGNDSAMAPWLDEALATYSEYIYYEEFFPQLRDWWWSFRVGWYNPQGAVDSTVYEFDSVRAYINAVYLRGVQMLHNLREDIGTEAFFDLLAAYSEAGAGDVAMPELFWALVPPGQREVTRQTREEFFQTVPEIPDAPADQATGS